MKFALPDGTQRELVHGDIVGRMPRAALSLNEPTLSEAHAMVSLRGSQMKLLALRGRLTVRGRSLAEVTLRKGMRIVLSSRVPLVVDDVSLPTTVLAVEAEGLPRQVISAVSALRTKPRLELSTGLAPDADALVWVHEDALYVRRAGEPDRALRAGDVMTIEGLEVRVVAVPLESAGLISTLLDQAPPLKLIVRYDTVHIHSGDEVHVLDGFPARIVSELALIGGPCDWLTVAKELWDAAEPAVLRERWDAALGRLRKKLKSLGLRTDLVRSTLSGQVELLLGPKDVVEDLA